jgi:hypothetical protein
MSEIDKVNVWLDKEGNFLDVTWGFGHTYYAATEDNRVMVLVDTEGNIQGFKIDAIRSFQGEFIKATLHPVNPQIKTA